MQDSSPKHHNSLSDVHAEARHDLQVHEELLKFRHSLGQVVHHDFCITGYKIGSPGGRFAAPDYRIWAEAV